MPTKPDIYKPFGLDQVRLKKLFNQRWQFATDQLITKGSLPFMTSQHAHARPFRSPTILANTLIEAYSLEGHRSGTTANMHPQGLLFLATCSLVADHKEGQIRKLATFLEKVEGIDYIRRESNRLFFLASVLKVRSEESLPSLAEFGAQALDCDSESIYAGLRLYLKFSSHWKPVSDLDAEEASYFESRIRQFVTTHSNASYFFLIALLPWLYYCKRFDEYSTYKVNLLSSPNQFAVIAEALLSLRERQMQPSLRLNHKTLEWLEWIRPGSSISSCISRIKATSWAQESATNELKLSIPYAYHADSDICMNRYLAATRSLRPNGLTQQGDGISFITSIYNGAEWLESFLLNMTSLNDFDRSELILINANSPQKEREIPLIRKYQTSHSNIIHIILDSDPGLYNVWNLGVLLASCPYLSNANLDDRKAKEYIPSHLNALRYAEKNVSLASAPSIVCDEKYIGYEEYLEKHRDEDHLSYYTSAEYYGYPDLFIDFVNQALERGVVWRNIPHCMPVWRRELHEKYGFFDEVRGGPTADLEFWLRCAKHGEVYRNLNTPKGLYYFSNQTTYSARKEHRMQHIFELHVSQIETANLSYLKQHVSLF